MEKSEEKYYHWAVGLSWFTIIYNILEGLVSTFYGFADETLSLFGFGLDSFIEMISGIGILVMVKRITANPTSEKSDFEKKALNITGYSLYALAILLVITAAISIYQKHQPESTIPGVLVASVSIGIMWWLIQKKIEVGKALHSDAIVADANCARVCMYMSMVLLGSSLLNFLFPVLYIDALGALGIAWFSYTEGKESLEKAKGIHACHCHQH
ncbi:MAG: cation transporter [Bacteroidetes bacterium]|nr:cation transporter [Bacteroidota bacterium]